jgi:hypothetical protein
MKFSKISIAILLTVILANCSGGNKVIYAKYGRLKLQDGEVNSYPVNNMDIRFFESCCYTGSDLIFLNRAIHNPSGQYDIYISVSEQLMPLQLQQIQTENSAFQVISEKSDLVNKIKVDAYLFSHNQNFVARFAYMEVKSGLMVIYDFTSKQEEAVKKIYHSMPSYLDGKIRL